MTNLSPRGQQLLRALAVNLQLVAEHERVAPSEVDIIFAALVQHIRSSKPMALLTGGPL